MKRLLMRGLLCSGLLARVAAAAGQDSEPYFYDQPYKTRSSGSFAKGAQIASFGYGLANISGTGYLNTNLSEKISHTNVGPLYLKYEYGLADEIGLGVWGAYAYARDVMSRAAPREYKTNAVSFGINAFYHFNKMISVENLDIYAGLGFGFKSVAVKSQPTDGGEGSKVSDNSGIFSLRLGARYYIIRGFGAFFEFGPDKMSAFNVGLSYKW